MISRASLPAPTPMAGKNQPVDWMFAFKFNAASFPGCTDDGATPKPGTRGIFGGQVQVYPNGHSQQYVYATSCNPYLAFSAITLAAIDGIENKIHPGDPLDKDIYNLSAAEYEKIGSAPANLEEALDALETDHDFLLKGDVFTADVIHYWIKYKRENEIDAIRMRPHPFEFCMYFDI